MHLLYASLLALRVIESTITELFFNFCNIKLKCIQKLFKDIIILPVSSVSMIMHDIFRTRKIYWAKNPRYHQRKPTFTLHKQFSLVQ